jgi:hypothetical protein
MTLPTPPGTSHRDKENRFPGVPHVVWSANNLIHDLTAILPLNIPIMASKSKRLPSKSILKNRDHRVLLPILEDNQKESTPEPSNPLTDINYLSSPVSKILDPDSSLRELIESYSILAALFQPIREHREAIIQAFIRDLAKALADPPKSENIPEESCTEDDVASLLPNPPKKRGMTAEQVKYARDLCTTCHAVMKVLATVFILPAVHKIFSSMWRESRPADLVTDSIRRRQSVTRCFSASTGNTYGQPVAYVQRAEDMGTVDLAFASTTSAI